MRIVQKNTKILLSNSNLYHGHTKKIISSDPKITSISNEKDIEGFLKQGKTSGNTELFLNIHGMPDVKNPSMLQLIGLSEKEITQENVKDVTDETLFSNVINNFVDENAKQNIIHVYSCFGGLAENDLEKIKGDCVIISYINADRSNVNYLFQKHFQKRIESKNLEDFISNDFYNLCATQAKIGYKIGKNIYKYDFDINHKFYTNDQLVSELQNKYSNFKAFYNQMLDKNASSLLLNKKGMSESLEVSDSLISEFGNCLFSRISNSKKPLNEINKDLYNFKNLDNELLIKMLFFKLQNNHYAMHEALKILFNCNKKKLIIGSDVDKETVDTILSLSILKLDKIHEDNTIKVLKLILANTNYNNTEECFTQILLACKKSGDKKKTEDFINKLDNVIDKLDIVFTKEFLSKILHSNSLHDAALPVINKIISKYEIETVNQSILKNLQTKNIEVLKLLLEHKDFKVTEKILQIATLNKNLDVIKLFSAQKDFDVTEKTMQFAILSKDLNIIKFFSEHKDFKLTPKLLKTISMVPDNKSIIKFFVEYKQAMLNNKPIENLLFSDSNVIKVDIIDNDVWTLLGESEIEV
jgi:hypothetical protein